MKSFTTYIAVAAAALVTGGLVATTVIQPTETAKPAAARTPVAAAPEQVRTQVVTRVIHRVHKVHLHPKRRHVAVAAAPAAPAPVVRAAPAPVPAVVPRRVAVAQSVPAANSAPAREHTPTLKTRSSGAGSGSQGSGGDDDGERHGDGNNEDHYEGGDD